DGPGGQAAVRADAGAEVRDFVRGLLQLRRPVLGLVRGDEGRGPDHPGGRVRARLPAAPRGAAAGDPQAAGEDRRRVGAGPLRLPPVGGRPDQRSRDAGGGQPVTVGWLTGDVAELFGPQAAATLAYDVLTVDVPVAAWTGALRAARDELGCTFF